MHAFHNILDGNIFDNVPLLVLIKYFQTYIYKENNKKGCTIIEKG